ncbi:hypothetical protein [Lysinibacillus sp. FSL W8-0992]|uniref:hypothetical protein n=1 Tax=Lysinibacillus sp. FSL W8-0992 TaxID=2954643 RepID=UPI0030F8425F
MNCKPSKASSIEETANRERPVPFYNWLNERDVRTQVINKPGNFKNLAGMVERKWKVSAHIVITKTSHIKFNKDWRFYNENRY